MQNINPRVDIAFKKIFGVEENKDLLISLINSIVSEQDQVEDIILLNPYNPRNFYNDKLSILDIKAKGLDGKMFNIEIQITDHADYDKRALYYWAKLYTEQLKAGSNYSRLSKAIGIHILYFTSILESSKYHNIFHIRERDTGVKYFNDLELHTIELGKFSNNMDEELTEFACKIKNSLDMWVAFLTRHDLFKEDNLPKAVDNKEFKKALHVLDAMNFSEEERSAYEDHIKWLMTTDSALAKKKDEGIEEGIIKGIAEGIAEEKINTARKLLGIGMPIEQIAEITELSIELILKQN